MSLTSIPLQETLEDAIVISGKGVHSGHAARMYLRPAPVDSGLRFRRIDLPGRPEIPAHVDYVTQTHLATTLGRDGAAVHTVEHVLSALVGMGVDNAVIEIEGPEIPIFDGSAGPFVRRIRDVGTALLPAEKHVWMPRQPVRVEDGDKWIEIEPAERLSVDYTLSYDHPVIGTQRVLYEHQPRRYEVDISHARTFALLRDLEAMRTAGLALGGDLDNAVAVGDDRVMNPDGLRYPDEFARHKILDIVGDLALVGGPIVGRIRAYKSGHTLNRQFVKELLAAGLVERAPLSEVPRRLRATPTPRIQVLSA